MGKSKKTSYNKNIVYFIIIFFAVILAGFLLLRIMDKKQVSQDQQLNMQPINSQNVEKGPIVTPAVPFD